jgi:lipopolysaccharide/colanic/teichoic acid biosynthesis glycosyltransferase
MHTTINFKHFNPRTKRFFDFFLALLLLLILSWLLLFCIITSSFVTKSFGVFFQKRIGQFGNTSSVSIPLTIATQLQGKFDSPKKLILSGFGVGMSWATAFITLDDCQISNLIEL